MGKSGIDEDSRRRVIQIAQHRGIFELSCKKCGCVNPIEKIDYSLFKHVAAAHCPDCGGYIRHMPKDGLPRFWNFASRSVEIVQKLDSSVLYYHHAMTNDKDGALMDEIIRRLKLTRNEHLQFESQLTLFE